MAVNTINLWLDDRREPPSGDHLHWTWAKTADQAIEFLKGGQVRIHTMNIDRKATMLAVIVKHYGRNFQY
jgi:hypothetical protein